MPLGILDTSFIDSPVGTDAAYLRSLQTGAGLSVAELFELIDERLGAYNGSLDALVAALVYPTDEAETEPTGVTAAIIKELGEHTLSRPSYSEQIKHALPLGKYGGSTEFTEDGLDRMTRNQILSRIDSLILGLRRNARILTLRRLFSDAEFRVTKNSAVVSPGFAGSGTGTNVFDVGYPDGSPLPSGYTHYLYADTDSAGALEAAVRAAIARLEKWHEGPFDAVASSDMITLFQALDIWADAGSALVRPAQGEREALVDAQTYEGVLGGKVRVRKALSETTDPVASFFKSYGPLDPRNPLAWRYDESRGRGAILRYRDLYPLAHGEVIQYMGIGVNNRVGAVNLYAASGAAAYVNPTIN